MSKQAKRLFAWFEKWGATKIMLLGADVQELAPKSAELIEALSAFADEQEETE